MPHPVLDGPTNGAITGAVGGLLAWGVLKAFKLDRYLQTKKPSPPAAPPTTWQPDTAYTPAPYLDVPSPPQTQSALIAVMWTLTGLAFVLGMSALQSPAIPLVIDLPAFIIAIVLLCKPGAVNKWNGGAKLLIEVIAFVCGFLFAFRASTSIAPAMEIRTLPGIPPPAPTLPAAPQNWPQPQGHIVPPPQFNMPPAPPMPPIPAAPPMPSGPFGH